MSIPSVLNHYRILEPLGKGGMGEVYAAEDTRLHRRVAIKVLSSLMAADPERRERFEREARAIAALNHPNIVTIHSVEEADGLPFLTMELVEGRALADVIPAGGLPLDALLRVGIAVSDAMAAAHQRGITHRDLKPGNVMVLPDGRVKVLDFGLAKLREEELDGGAMTSLPTTDLTGEGRIIGTVAYMSPEQAEGKAVDQRSDIFSLGVMLHEMATGQRPFKGDTNVSVISSILKDTPSSITDLNPALPVDLAKIIRRTLAKDPTRRFQTATDLRNELEELKQEIDSGVTIGASSVRPRPQSRRANTRAIAGVAIGVALLAAVLFAVYRWRVGGAAGFDAERFTRLTSTGNALTAAISADGRYVVHVKNQQQFRVGLWVRQTATASDVQIVPAANVRYDGVTFSPDGNYVYYVTYELTGGIGTLYKLPVLGGTPQRILEDIDSAPSFSPDGRRFAFLRGQPAAGRNYAMVADQDGSNVRQLGTVEPPDQLQLNAISWSPDGRTLATTFQSLREGPHMGCMVLDAESGAARPVPGRWASMNDVTWMPDGRSLLVSAVELGGLSPQLWQVSYPSGERRRITNDLNNYVGVSVSHDGTSIATVQAENISNLWVMPADSSSPPRQITTGRGRGDGISGISWTPDGRLVFSSTASGLAEIWVMNADGSGQLQLTSGQRPSIAPTASGDGRYAIFQRVAPDGIFLHRIGLDASSPTQLTSGGADFAPISSRDGRWVYYYSPASGAPRPMKVPIDGGTPVSLGDVYFRPTSVSPDDRLLLGVSWDDRQRRSTLATMSVDGGPVTLLDLPAIAISSWSPDGRSVVYMALHDEVLNLWSRPIEGGVPRLLTNFTADVTFWFAFSRDGKQLALARGTGSSDVVVITRK